MRRDGGLRQPGTLVELAGTDAQFERVVLLDEIALRVLQPVQHVASHGVGEGLDDFVEIDFQGVCHGCIGISRWDELYIAPGRYVIV
ncbi:hypothetical protein D9M71_747960 [compost metagenome]